MRKRENEICRKKEEIESVKIRLDKKDVVTERKRQKFDKRQRKQ